MKSKDLTLIVAVAVFSAIFAFILSSFVISPADNLQTTVEQVDKIEPTFSEVDTRYFNESSVNPTQLIRVNENQNVNPFDDGATEPTDTGE